MGIRMTPEARAARRAAVQEASRRRWNALVEREEDQERRRLSESIHWQESETLPGRKFGADNGRPDDDPGLVSALVDNINGLWILRLYVGDSATPVRSEHASLAEAQAAAVPALTSNVAAPSWDQASWADAATSHPPRGARRDPAEPCGGRRTDGGRCRNVGDCPHHPR